MKAIIEEHDGCFAINLSNPESDHEIALMVRMGMNATKEVRSCITDVFADGEFATCVVIGKHKKSNSDIPKRK